MQDFDALASHDNKEASRSLFCFAMLTLLVCLLAYGIGLKGPLFLDDESNLLSNQQVQIDGATFDDWRAAALSSDSGILYRPIAMLTFALNHAVAGSFTPLSLKATNLAIHLIIGALLYLFALALLQAPALRVHRLNHHQCKLMALIAASIWLLHPIHVSTVLYAVQRMAQLSTAFTLAGLLVYTRYRLRWVECGGTPGELLAAALWIVLLGLCALLSKENGAVLPWLIAVVEVILLRGIWRGQPRRWLLWLAWLALVLPVLLVLALYLMAPEILLGRHGEREFTLYNRLLTQGRALWQYLSWMLVPNITGMGLFHDDIVTSRSLWVPFTTVVSLFAWVAALGACLLWHRRYPLFTFAFLFYLVAHSMESTVLPLEMVFENRNYLPSMGLAVLVALGIVKCVVRVDRLRLRTLAGGILGVLVVLLLVRTNAWVDEIRLARFNVINHPQSARANFFYANALFKRPQQSTELELNEEEQRTLAVTSRGYFERMRSIDERKFSALVMLYQLDTQYFPGLAQENDWLAVIAESSLTYRLQSSDITALGALVDFSLTPQVGAEQARVWDLLKQLGARHPNNLKLLFLQYRYMIAAKPAQKASLLPMLQRAALAHPNSLQPPALLAQYYGSDDLAGTYEAIREWMRRDQYRRELPVIREIFSQ